MNKKQTHNFIYPLLGILGFLVFWQILAAVVVRNTWLLPTPRETAAALAENFSLLMHHSGYTLAEAILGLLLSVALALILAWLLTLNTAVRKAVYPLLLGSQMVPIIVLAPLFLIWFGYGLLPKVLVVILVCFFPMVINILAGLNAVDSDTLGFYRIMGMSEKQLFFKVRLPYALPYFFGGLRVSAAYSVMGAVIGEWLGAEAGLGLLLTRAQRSFDLPLTFAAIFMIILWSALIFGLLALSEKLTLRWNPNQKKEI